MPCMSLTGFGFPGLVCSMILPFSPIVWLCLISGPGGPTPSQNPDGPWPYQSLMLAKTVANVNQPPCRVASDTAKPTLPTQIAWPLENPLLVTVPYNPSLKNFRDVFAIRFDDSTSGTSICAFLRHFNATIIGGFGHGTSAPAYVVRVPDPGATFEAVESLQAVMGRHPGVTSAFAMNYAGSFRLRGKSPIDSTKPRVPNEDPHITSARTSIKRRGLPSAKVASDTTKPPIPALSYPDDPDFVVASPTTPGIIYYRRLMGVAFWDTTSGVTVRRLLSKYQASIAGGMPFTGTYILKFPDPGSGITALTARREQLKGEPGVKYVLLLTSRDAPPALD